MGNYATEYYAEDAVFPLANQVLDGVFYGMTGNNLEGTVVVGGGVGYPAVGDVQLSVVYGASNEFIGTLALPTEAQVQSGVGYGAGGTEFTGTLVGGGGTDWTADERTAIRAILGIPGSGSTPVAPSAGALSDITKQTALIPATL
jgi:hypothetical protein